MEEHSLDSSFKDEKPPTCERRFFTPLSRSALVALVSFTTV